MKYTIELHDSTVPSRIPADPIRRFVGAVKMIPNGDSVALLNEDDQAFVYIHLAPGQYLFAKS